MVSKSQLCPIDGFSTEAIDFFRPYRSSSLSPKASGLEACVCTIVAFAFCADLMAAPKSRLVKTSLDITMKRSVQDALGSAPHCTIAVLRDPLELPALYFIEIPKPDPVPKIPCDFLAWRCASDLTSVMLFLSRLTIMFHHRHDLSLGTIGLGKVPWLWVVGVRKFPPASITIRLVLHHSANADLEGEKRMTDDLRIVARANTRAVSRWRLKQRGLYE